MFVSGETSRAYQSGHAVGRDRNPAMPFVLVGDYRCHSPGDRGMCRRKRAAPIKEPAVPGITTGARPLGDVFQNLGYDGPIGGRFGDKQPCLASLWVIRDTADQIEGASYTRYTIDISYVADVLADALVSAIVVELSGVLSSIPVCRDQSSGPAGKRDEPAGLLASNMQWPGPDRFLIAEYVLQ
jgi:hypothetical protein